MGRAVRGPLKTKPRPALSQQKISATKLHACSVAAFVIPTEEPAASQLWVRASASSKGSCLLSIHSGMYPEIVRANTSMAWRASSTVSKPAPILDGAFRCDELESFIDSKKPDGCDRCATRPVRPRLSWRASTKSARQRSGGPCSDSAAAADSFFAAPLVDSSQQAKRIHDHRRVADGLSGWADRNHEQPAGNNGEPDKRERKKEGFKGRHLRTAGFRLPPKGGLPFATGPKSRENLPTAAVYTIHTRVVCPIGHTDILSSWKASA